MDSEDIQQLITELRRILVEYGFNWVLDEAEADLLPNAPLRTRALALIDAAEGVTTHLAEVELSTLATLEVEEIHFEPDEEAFVEGDLPTRDSMESPDFHSADYLSSMQRREQLESLAGKRSTFIKLKRMLGDDK